MIIDLTTAFVLAGSLILIVFWFVDYVVNQDLENENEN